MSATASPARPERYPKLRRVLHWIGGPLLLIALAAGFVAHNTDPASGSHLWALRLHVLFGGSGAALTVVRIIACLRLPGPAPLDLPAWRQRVFELDHRLLYLSAVLLGLTGVAMLTLGGVGAYLLGSTPMPDLAGAIPRTVHGVLAFVFLGLFVAHLGGVISYQLTKGQTARRISLGR